MHNKEELELSLPLRAESREPRRLYFYWQKIVYEPDYAKDILPLREEVYKEYEQMAPREGQVAIGHLVQHWNSLPNELRQSEPHSVQKNHVALNIAPKYMHLGRTKGRHWLPLIFQPLILLWP